MTTDTPRAVLLERLPGHVALVTLNREPARNAINGAIATQLEAIVRETEADPEIWTVVLTGAGESVFCAGADLKEISAGRGEALGTERGGFAGFVYAERTKPWIAAVKGKALAGGCEIVLSCDMVVASETAAFGVPEVMRGLVAAAGGLYRLPRAIPRNIAVELIVTGGLLDAQRAYQLGLVNRLAAPGKVVETALELARAISANAPLAVRASLAIAKRSHEASEADLRQLSANGFALLGTTEDYKEGPLAFIEKRAPRWTGR